MQTKPVGLVESAWHVAFLGHGLSAQTFTRISQMRPETNVTCDRYLFVCVEVLRPSQSIRVVSSAVNLPNHAFVWAGLSSKRLTSTCAHSFARNWQLPFLDQGKGKNNSRKYFMIDFRETNVAGLGGDWTRDLLIFSRTRASDWATEAGFVTVIYIEITFEDIDVIMLI